MMDFVNLINQGVKVCKDNYIKAFSEPLIRLHRGLPKTTHLVVFLSFSFGVVFDDDSSPLTEGCCPLLDGATSGTLVPSATGVDNDVLRVDIRRGSNPARSIELVRWNSPQGVSQSVETVSPILELLSLIVNTFS